MLSTTDTIEVISRKNNTLIGKRRVNFNVLMREVEELQKYHNPKNNPSEIDKIAYGI